MKNSYLIVDASIPLAEIVKKIYFYRWSWKDDIDETNKTPYTRFYVEEESETRIYYREEHKQTYNSRYFYIEGEKIEAVVAVLKRDMPLVSTEELQRQLVEETDSLKRGSAIYQLGIAFTGQPFELAIMAAFEKALQDEVIDVRLAALNGIAWLAWDELLTLIENAQKDEDINVSRKANILLEALKFGKTSNAFLSAMQEEDVEEQDKKIQLFNSLFNELLEKFPQANWKAIAREASIQFGISLEEALNDLEWARSFDVNA